tara:strand:- start:1905 stop:2372 length:468 start_codon:yes stop_codon:yes gene_type:complete
MATGPIYRFAKRNEDGTIEQKRLVVEPDGSRTVVSESIFTSENPILNQSFTDEINRLIQAGEIVIPSQEVSSHHVVDITDQLESEKYTYNIVSKGGIPLRGSDILRVFLDGVNVSQDVAISDDRFSFTFIDLYPGNLFGTANTRLVIDFIEYSGE